MPHRISFQHLLPSTLHLRPEPISYVTNHNPQNPTIDRKERQPRHKETRHERALAEKLELVRLLEPETLTVTLAA